MLFDQKVSTLPAMFFLCLLYLMIVFLSCKKLVDVGEPLTTITTNEVFSTDAQANSALAGIYSNMINKKESFINGDVSIYCGLSSDELLELRGPSDITGYQFSINMLQANNTIINSSFWQSAYGFIYGANAAIDGLAASNSGLLHDSVKRELTGEAKFIRAFCYFYLTNIFGDIPLVLTTDFNKTALSYRVTQEKIYEQIIQDLKDAQIALVPDYSVGLGERVRPNKWAATALLARVYLYMNDWANAEAQSSTIINNVSLFKLVDTLNIVFNKNSTEAIWQLQQNSSGINPFNGTWEGYYFIPRFSIFESIAPISNYLTSYSPAFYLSDQLVNAFEIGDQRMRIWVHNTASTTGTVNGITYYYPYKYILGNTYETPFITSGGTISQYYMMFRLAEQYLIRAEARAQRNNVTDALVDLNAIRRRAGLPDFAGTGPTTLLAAIAHERQIEFFAEWGHRWFDLKRTGQAVTILSEIPMKQPFYKSAVLYPIPASELISDPNLIQNPGY